MSLLSKLRLSVVLFFVLLPSFCTTALAAPWLAYGPYGGDARSLAADPADHTRLYLGTVTGWVYESTNSGASWRRLASVGKRDDLVLDNIVVDASNAKHILVGAWSLGKSDGGLFQSSDSGKSWSSTPEMKGQSVLALAAAPSDPSVFVAGTLTGIYRSSDSGATWSLISPPENREIHEVESIAIDPKDPGIIYAGTWHLPWKTTDGGKSWANIKEGVIDDSDVFSIIVDPKNPKIVFASACSGIYKSGTAGEIGDLGDKTKRFHKIEGIPKTARRTRVLMEDPQHEETVFAGTTEGLYRSTDAGKTWSRTTGPEVIVNDVFIDPTDSKKVMLATDRGGVLTSSDGGSSFQPSNTGFSTRQITAFVGDSEKPGTMYAGVVNDKQWGGVFATDDGGLTWKQQSAGLGGSDVFSLGQAFDGSLIAGTAHGVYRYEEAIWTKAADVPLVVAPKTPVRQPSSGKRTAAGIAAKPASAASKGPPTTRLKAAAALVEEPVAKPAHWDDATVYTIVRAGEKMFAGTSVGLVQGDASGKTWTPVPSAGVSEWRLLAAAKGTIVAVGYREMKLSLDGGLTWADVQAPEKLTRVMAVAMDDLGEIWVGGHEGVFLSSDQGRSWQTLNNLYVPDVDGLYFDPHTSQLFVASSGEDIKYAAFAVEVKSRKVSFWEPGWNLRFVRPVGDHLIGATLFDGIVIQPRMVETKEAGAQ